MITRRLLRRRRLLDAYMRIEAESWGVMLDDRIDRPFEEVSPAGPQADEGDPGQGELDG